MTTAHRVLVVDDIALVEEHVVARLGRELPIEATCVRRPEDVPAALAAATFDLAIVDLHYANTRQNGLHALYAIHDAQPACALIVYTDGDDLVGELLRDAWHAFDLAALVSKGSRTQSLLDAVGAVLAGAATPWIDPIIATQLPGVRAPQRSLDSYGRLMAHRGHARMWQALAELDDGEATYENVAALVNVRVTAINNYRSDVRDELRNHDVKNPTMAAMQVFAKRCAALLAPHIARRLGT